MILVSQNHKPYRHINVFVHVLLVSAICANSNTLFTRLHSNQHSPNWISGCRRHSLTVQSWRISGNFELELVVPRAVDLNYLIYFFLPLYSNANMTPKIQDIVPTRAVANTRPNSTTGTPHSSNLPNPVHPVFIKKIRSYPRMNAATLASNGIVQARAVRISIHEGIMYEYGRPFLRASNILIPSSIFWWTTQS